MTKAGGLWRRVGWCAAGLGLVLAGSWARAFVNPNFTPKNVERDAKLILTVKLDALDADGKGASLAVGEVIKGKSDAKRLRIDFAAALAAKDPNAKLEEFIDLLKSVGTSPALLAIGDFEGKPCALLHAGACWTRLAKGRDEATWDFERLDIVLNGTFNGGTDMFIETMRFIRKFPNAPIMPVSGGVQWSEQVKLGRLPGKPSQLLAVDVNGDGRLDLFAGCPEGDRIFLQEKGGKFAEKPLEPGSKSLAAAWADFDGDGRPDLASLSKEGPVVWLQREPGKFTFVDAFGEGGKRGQVVTAIASIGIVDLEPDGKPDLVVCAEAWPIVCKNDGKGGFSDEALPAEAKPTDRGIAGPCVVADFDGDGFADVVQTFQKGGLLWRGRAGGFEPPVECGALMGKVQSRRACVADLDGDGLLDIFLIGGERTPFLLQNRGGARFEEVMRLTGEPGYIIQPGATCAALADFNNDTFVDIFAGSEEEPGQFFFNRGFRSFAVHEPLKFKDEDLPGCEKQGQAAAVWADFDAGGAQKLAVALSGISGFAKATGAGTAIEAGAEVFWDQAKKLAKTDPGGGANGRLGRSARLARDADEAVAVQLPAADLYLCQTTLGTMDKPMTLRVAAPQEARSAAGQVVRFYLEGRCLGARVAERWGAPAILGVAEAGTYIVKFRNADGQEVCREMEPGGEARPAAEPTARTGPAGQAALPRTAPAIPSVEAPAQWGGIFIILGVVAMAFLVLVGVLVGAKVFRKVNP